MKKETENKQVFSFKKGHTLPMSDEYFDFLENCQKALLIGNLRGMIFENNDNGKPSFLATSGIGNEKAKMAFTFYKRFSDINKFTHFLVHEDDLQYYKDFIENFALETGQVFTHRLRGKSTEYKIAFIPPIVDQNTKSSINIGDEYRKDLETLSSFEVGSDEQDKQIKYMLQKYVAICLNYTDGKLNEVYTDHGNITVIVYKDNKMFTNVYSKVNKITGEKIEFRDFDNVPKMFNDRINGFKGKKTMTYDFILMNPPYDKNLHLKIVEQSIPMLTDEGILVNLSPIRWLQDPLAKYKKDSDYITFGDSVGKHIANYKVIAAKESQCFFDNTMNIDLCIYTLTKKTYKIPDLIDPVISRLVEFNQLHKPLFDKNKNNGWRVRFPIITVGKSGGSGKRTTFKQVTFGKLISFYNGKRDGKWWYEFYNKNQYSKTTETITNSIPFSTEPQSEHFINQFELTFVKYYMLNVLQDVHVLQEQVLWVDEIKNPRTHKMGYDSDWTNEDLCKVFGITGFISDTEAEKGSEWETILETMKPYL